MPKPRTLFFNSAEEAQTHANSVGISKGRPIQCKFDESRWMFSRSIRLADTSRVPGYLCSDKRFRNYLLVYPKNNPLGRYPNPHA